MADHQTSRDNSRRWRPTSGRIVQLLLAGAGLVTFGLLVGNVDFAEVTRTGASLPLLAGVVLALAAVNYWFDTASWWLVCDSRNRPSLRSLMSIRVRSEALTNTLPGGALIGEPMKVMLLSRSAGISRAEATTSFLLSKFSIIVGQVVYVVTGVILSYDAMNAASERVFGTAHFATLVLGIALLVLLLMVTLLGAMVWFQPMLRWLIPTSRDGRWPQRWNRLVAEAHGIESLVAEAARRHRWTLALSVLCAVIAWALNGVESYIILRWLDVDVSFTQAYAIDAVSCIARMVLFVLPIGIGGQDWTVTGLLSVHGIADPIGTSARLVVLKRGREFFVIAVGLVMLAVSGYTSRVRKAVTVESSVGDLGGDR